MIQVMADEISAMADEISAFDQLALEQERTWFVFYGCRDAEGGEPGGPCYKAAHSLAEALADLHSEPRVAAEGGYLVKDAFLVLDEEGPGDHSVHVELASLREIAEFLEDGD
jgi:hypothetical protein